MPNYTASDTPRKTCSKCRRNLPLSQFDADRRKPLGVRSQCKDCSRAYRRAAKPHWLKTQRERRADNPDYDRKRIAWNAVYYAVRTGKLDKPGTCAICGEVVDTDNIQAHHDDYDRPYDVVWCCATCHVALDDARREAEA